MRKNSTKKAFHSSKYEILLFSSLISLYPAWRSPMPFCLKYACGHNPFFLK